MIILRYLFKLYNLSVFFFFLYIYMYIFVLTATETESQHEVKIEDDLSDTKSCSSENDCNSSKILHEVCKNVINLLTVIFLF